jgi:hypothetical protein
MGKVTGAQLVLAGTAILPVVLYGVLATTGCANSGTGPSGTTSGSKKNVHAPMEDETCASDLVETTRDGESWCCSPLMRWCQTKGAPVVDTTCATAGEIRAGATLSYEDDTCAGTAFHASEERLTTRFECRKSGDQLAWKYVAPTSWCSETVARSCDSSSIAEKSRAATGTACETLLP